MRRSAVGMGQLQKLQPSKFMDLLDRLKVIKGF
jgi:hypothetical protein